MGPFLFGGAVLTKVEVVNAQQIDGVHRKSGEVIDVSPGRARDLINAGKANAAVKHAPAPSDVKGGK